MRTDVAFDKLCDTLPIIKGIVDKAKADPEKLAQLKAASAAKSKLEYLVVLPPMLKSFKDEIFAMLAVWNEMKVEDIAAQEISTTIKQVIDIFGNKDIMDFLSPAQETARENTAAEEFSNTSEITEEVSATPDIPSDAFASTFPIE